MPVQANNIYVGARYIPRIMGEYNNETAYEALDIVTSGGVGYISRQPVPAGTAVTNKEYWAMWGSGNAAIDSLTQRVATMKTIFQRLKPVYSKLTKSCKIWLFLGSLQAPSKGMGVQIIRRHLDSLTQIPQFPSCLVVTLLAEM